MLVRVKISASSSTIAQGTLCYTKDYTFSSKAERDRYTNEWTAVEQKKLATQGSYTIALWLYQKKGRSIFYKWIAAFAETYLGKLNECFKLVQSSIMGTDSE